MPIRAAGLVLGLAVAIISSFPISGLVPVPDGETLVFFAALATLLNMVGFVVSDRGGMGLRSLVWIAFGLFVSFPTVVYLITRQVTLPAREAISALLLAQLAVFLLLTATSAWRRVSTEERKRTQFPKTRPLAVALIYTVCAGAHSFIPMLADLFSAFMVLSTTLLALHLRAVISARSYLDWRVPFLSIAVVLMFGGWYVIAFDGFGRINVASFIFAISIIWLSFSPSRFVKLLIIALIPLGLYWGSLLRLQYVGHDPDNWSEIFLQGQGIGSVLAPVYTFLELVERESSLLFPSAEILDQLVFTLLFWVPSSLWASKPEGFGRLLTYQLRPDLQHTHHSMAASFWGDWFAYLGAGGFTMATILFVGLVLGLVKLLEKFAAAPHGSSPVWFCVRALVVGQTLTLVWGGIASFAPRAGLFVIGGMLMSAVLFVTRGRFILPGFHQYEHPYRRRAAIRFDAAPAVSASTDRGTDGA